MNRLAKRVISTIVASTMMVTNCSVNALAGGDGSKVKQSSAGDGNGGSSVPPATGGDFGVRDNPKNGVRISLVDIDDPSKVVSVDENGDPTVIDILYTTEGGFNESSASFTTLHEDHVLRAVKTQRYDDANVQNQKIKRIFTNTEVYPRILNEQDKKDGMTEDYDENSRITVGEYLFGNMQSSSGVGNFFNWARFDGSFICNGKNFMNWMSIGETGSANMNGQGNDEAQKVADEKIPEVKDYKPETATKKAGKQTKYVKSKPELKASAEKQLKSNKNSGNAISIFQQILRFEYLIGLLPFHMSLSSSSDDFIIEAHALTEEVQNTSDTKVSMGGRHDKGDMTGNAEANTDHSSSKTEAGTDKPENVQKMVDVELKLPVNLRKYYIMRKIAGLRTDDAGHKLLMTKSVLDKINSGNKEATIADCTEEWVCLVEPIVFFTPMTRIPVPKPGDYGTKLYGTISSIYDYVADRADFYRPCGILTNSENFMNYKAFSVLWNPFEIKETLDLKKVKLEYIDFEYKDSKTADEINKLKEQAWNTGTRYVIQGGKVGTSPNALRLSELNRWQSGAPEATAQIGDKELSFTGESVWKSGHDVAAVTMTALKNGFNGGKPADIKLAKWYVARIGDTELVEDVVTDGLYYGKILVDNEGDPNKDDDYYEVEGFATGYEDLVPKDGDTSTTYEEYRDKNKGSYASSGQGYVEIKPTDKDKVLYVKLVGKPTNKLSVLKYFYDSDDTLVNIEIDSASPKEAYDAHEDGYSVIEWRQTPDIPISAHDWSEVPSSSNNGTSESITIGGNTQTIYIQYKEQEAADNQIVLHENEIAHTYRLQDLNSLIKSVNSFKSREASDEHGHWESDDDGDDYWVVDHESNEIQNEEHYNFNITNKADYNSTNFIGANGSFLPIENGDVEDSGEAPTIGAFSTGGVIPNLQFSLYRDKGKDNVTLYPNKSNNKSELANIGITRESYTYNGGRIKDKGKTDWVSKFFTKYQYSALDNKITGRPEYTCHDGSPGYISAYGKPDVVLQTINAKFSQTNNVMEKAYLGEANTGDETSTQSSNAFSVIGTNFSRNNTYKSTEAGTQKFISFFPYIKMEYQTANEFDASHKDSGSHKAYVTSTNVSKISKNASVEAGIYQSGGSGPDGQYGIGLQSEQWSTHARAISGLESKGVSSSLSNISLIPGGATMNLQTNNTNKNIPEVYLGFRAFEMCIPDELKDTIQEKDMVTTSQAKQNGTNFYNQVQSMLKGYQLEKWISIGIEPKESGLHTWEKVSGEGEIGTFDGNELQHNSKYYLKTGSTDGNGAQFSLTNQAMEQHVYRVYADITPDDTAKNGETVNVTKDGNIIATARIKSDKNVSELLSNSEVDTVNKHTRFVDNFVAALDINKGSSRQDEGWYCEAHDGIEVVETDAKMQIIFGDENGNPQVRSEVIDPHLVGKLESRADTLSMEDSKTRTVQYRMSNSSLNADADKGSGYIGTFDGMDICIPNINKVMRSRLHYMSNNTVMDLN